MKPRTNGVPRDQRSKGFQGEGPNWVLIAGGALLSTLSIRLGYKLKQMRMVASNAFQLRNFFGSQSQAPDGTGGMVEIKQQQNGQLVTKPEMALPLVTVPAPEFAKENGVIWATSPDLLELPQKPFHHSNCSDSPCVSESGSDIFSKREVIQKLRQQLKRRDDMILEMQDLIGELQNV